MLKDIVGNLRRAAAATTALDDQIPVCCESCRRRKLWDNTLVVFTGDNGYLLGRHGLWSKGLASDPPNMYEEVVHVPLILAWPGKIPTDAMAPELVSFYDVMPTLCEAAGVAAPANRGLTGGASCGLRSAIRCRRVAAVAQSGVRASSEYGDGSRHPVQARAAERG